MNTADESRSSATPRGGRVGLLVALGVVVLLRVVGLLRFPVMNADEGGWPLAVRVWLTQGWATFDYHMAPAYHWLLAIPYAVFGPSHTVGRATSAVVGLVGLGFAYGIGVRTFATRKAALWGVVLLGTSYQAILIDRRALIEPFQVTAMLALTFFFLRRQKHDVWAVVLCTAALLLIKASAIFLLPALAASLLWRPPGERFGAPERKLVLALAAGVGITAAVFGWLYLKDPKTFLSGWAPNMSHVSEGASSSARAGRFGLDPKLAVDTIRKMGDYEPLLCGLAVAAMVKGWLERKHVALAAWFLFGLGFLLIQLYVQENHRVVIVAPMALLAGTLLAELDDQAPRLGIAGVELAWPGVLLVLIVGFSAVRVAGGVVAVRDPRASAVRWLREHVDRGSKVAAAPYILMRLESRPQSFWWFDKPYLPTAERLRADGVEWVALDEPEWANESKMLGATEDDLERTFSRCCDVVTKIDDVTIMRVRRE